MTDQTCTRHKCGDCGRFVTQASVIHYGAHPDYEYGAEGRCSRHGTVDVWCYPHGEGRAA